MRIFVYEHITGGGLAGDPALEALAPEGELMLRALLADLAALPGIELTVLRDARLKADLPARVVYAGGAQDACADFRRLAREADAVWPIAPEQDGVLERLSAAVNESGARLLGCRLDSLRIAASKRLTAECLARAGLRTIATFPDPAQLPDSATGYVAKPDDGAGCQESFYFAERAALRAWCAAGARRNFAWQPYVEGEARSLTLLCCAGRARLLACNRQRIDIALGRFEFGGVEVNALADEGGRCAALAQGVARALPGLWGLVGIDYLETAEGPVVVEVNPRLTTAYAGLRDALGVNPAALVLELPGSLDAASHPTGAGRAVDIRLTHAH